MAYVKIKQIYSTLNAAVEYVVNEAKVDTVIEGSRLGSLVTSNCAIRPWEAGDVLQGFDLNAKLALAQRGRGRAGRVLAHHIIQSFAPGEVKPDVAHEIGVRFIEEITGGDYDYVIATHIDREHIHNHILMSPINRESLLRMEIDRTFLGNIRNLSDALCLEYGLSIITPADGKQRPQISEVYASAARRSKREILRERIDDAIRETSSWHEAVTYLREHHVEVETRPTEIVYRLTDIDMQRPLRGSSLGIAYTEHAIQTRIAREYIYDFTVQVHMMDPYDRNSTAIFMPGSRPYRYVVIPNKYITYHGRTATFFLPESNTVQILNEMRAIEGTAQVPDLYDYFAQPDYERDVKRASRLLSQPSMGAKPKKIRRGKTERQQNYYAMVDEKIETLRRDTFVTNRFAEYLAKDPDGRDTYMQMLATDIAEARLALEGTILAWQARADGRGHDAGEGIEPETIDDALTHLALLHALRDRINEHRAQDHHRPHRHRLR